MEQKEETGLAVLGGPDIVTLERLASYASHILAFFEMIPVALKSNRINQGFFSMADIAEQYVEVEKRLQEKPITNGRGEQMKADYFVSSWLDLSPKVDGFILPDSDNLYPIGITFKMGRDTTGLGDYIEHSAYAKIESIYETFPNGFRHASGIRFELEYKGYSGKQRVRKLRRDYPFPLLLESVKKRFTQIDKEAIQQDHDQWEEISREVEEQMARDEAEAERRRRENIEARLKKVD